METSPFKLNRTEIESLSSSHFKTLLKKRKRAKVMRTRTKMRPRRTKG